LGKNGTISTYSGNAEITESVVNSRIVSNLRQLRNEFELLKKKAEDCKIGVDAEEIKLKEMRLNPQKTKESLFVQVSILQEFYPKTPPNSSTKSTTKIDQCEK
jgi:hypothetical protein